jgi:hypothetical protein
MTDLSDRLAALLQDEPPAPYDIERIVAAGRRARRRRTMALTTAGALGAAGLTAGVVVPVVVAGGDEATVRIGVQPSPSPTSPPRCYIYFNKSGKGHPKVRYVPSRKACRDQIPPEPSEDNATPDGPRYRYSEKPTDIAARLESHLRSRVTEFGLTITYVRAFAQETDTLDSGNPSYFTGNIDVHQPSGYADIGVQVTHKTSEPVPFDGDCTAADKCEETTLADGSVLRTGQVKAGRGLVVLTAEVHRPDGVVVQAQESNYPFGPDAGSQPHGDQPLSLEQLVSLAKDSAFTF